MNWKKLISGFIAGAVGLTSVNVMVPSQNVQAETASSIDASQFQEPDLTYAPGVRWWWPGGSVEEEELIREIEYLAENGFGYVEINPFYIKDEDLLTEEEKAKVKNIYTPEFYELLDAAITAAEEKGIVVDLNMGSGWNANSQYVEVGDSMGNMALGRTTISGASITSAEISIPEVQMSNLYYGSAQQGTWDTSEVKLQGILLAETTGTNGTELNAYNVFNDDTVSYPYQIELNSENSYFFDAGELTGGSLTLSQEILGQIDPAKDYELIALYYVPSGGFGIDCALDWYVVDHMDADKAIEYINDWVGDASLQNILSKHENVRALFNDSYEFYSDVYYTESLYDLAKDSDNNGLNYDFSKYLPTVYKEYSAAPFYKKLGTNDTFLTFTLDSDEKSRITYDYNTLVNLKFQEGLSGFQSATNSYGYLYRQQAYNPPIDTIGSAQYVDIPEAEQAGELALIRAASGAHLYGRNLVTAEQYTLGTTPFKNTLEQVKIGYDIMATSGINNFFYHGYNYIYQAGTDTYGENGWSPMSSIGINVTENNTLAPYFADMNTYAARVNYLMQQGQASKDVALYMPFNGSLSETEAVAAMNSNGYAWDAINDDSIQADNTTYENGKISVNGGTMEYEAILVETTSLPVATMEKLKALADDGAAIIFYGAAPSTQPGYADGDYAQEDQKVADLASEMINQIATGYTASNTDELVAILENEVSPTVTYDNNENVRFIRRTLEDGGELVYIRNLSEDDNTITIRTNGYENYYWLDQSTGAIYEAEAVDGVLTFTLQSGNDVLNTRSMAVALLCEPAGVALENQDLTEGTPAVVDPVEPKEQIELTMESLTVTADNFDGVIGGEEETVVYTEDILGKWNDANFHEGRLQTVVSDGIYKTSFTLDQSLKNKKLVLNLGEVYTAANIKVNGTDLGNVMFKPYEIDISSALTIGSNDIEITVTPRKMNRYYNTTDGQYSASELQDAGLAGPITIGVYENGNEYETEDQSDDKTKDQTEEQNKKVLVNSVSIGTSSASMFVKETLKLTAKTAPANATNSSLTWSSSNTAVATVDAAGTVTARKKGTAIITAATLDGSNKSVKCTITVVKPTVKFNVKNAKLQVKKTTKAIIATGLQKGDSIAKYSSSKKSVATINKKGKIKAKKAGKTKITVTTVKGAKATMTLKVTKKAVKTTKITVNKKKISLKKGKNYTITVTRKPVTATDKITYQSSNKKVATVSKKGKIKARKKGKATITIKTANGKTAKVKVTVK